MLWFEPSPLTRRQWPCCLQFHFLLLILSSLFLYPDYAHSSTLEPDNLYSRDSICSGLTSSQCQSITTLTSLQAISQRDVAYNKTVLDVMYLGLDLTSTLFELQGYTETTIKLVSQVLFLGYKSVHMDLYWNEEDSTWQLCPFIMDTSGKKAGAPFTETRNNVTCDSSVTLQDVLQECYSYISATSSAFVMSVLHFGFRLHSLGTPQSSTSSSTLPLNQHLSWVLFDTFGTALYTPVNLLNDRQNGHTYTHSSGIPNSETGFPIVYRFLMIEKKRLLVSVNNATLATNSSYSTSYLKQDADDLFLSASSQNDAGFPELLAESKSDADLSLLLNTSLVGGSTSYTTETIDEPTCLSLTPSEFIRNLTFSSSNNTNNNSDDVTELSASARQYGQWAFVVDTISTPFTLSSISSFITCGYIPIVSAPVNVNNISSLVPLANSAIWSWAPDQPTIPSSSNDTGSSNNNNNNNSSDDDDIAANYRCTVLDESGWRVEDCNKEYPTLCSFIVPSSASQDLAQSLAYTWVFGEPSKFSNVESSCSFTYNVTSLLSSRDINISTSSLADVNLPLQFSIPQSALQDTSVRIQLASNDSIGYPIWIDLNSMAVSDCWVTGGPDANCPYNPAQWNRNKVALLSIAVTVTFFLLVVIGLLQLAKLPIRHNETRWKKLINKHTESQYEGVPA